MRRKMRLRDCRRFAVGLAFFVVPAFSLSAADLPVEVALSFPDSAIVYPSSGDFADVYPMENDRNMRALRELLEGQFGIEWTDRAFPVELRKSLAAMLSPMLSSLLPCKSVIFSKPHFFDDGSENFRFKNLDTGKAYTVVMKDGRITSMSMV